MSNRLDPDPAKHFVGPDLGPKCLQKLSADDTRRKRGNARKVSLLISIFPHRRSKPSPEVVTRV